MSNLNNKFGIRDEIMKASGYKAYGCEMCLPWLHIKCLSPYASETMLKILFKFNSKLCNEIQYMPK